MRRLLAIALGLSLLPVGAMAQDDLDLEGGNRRKARKNSRQELENKLVREIERGWYLKANVGSTMYLGNRGAPILRPGTTLGVTLGQDVIDKDKASFGWELIFVQGLHNGLSYADQGGLNSNVLIQGDTHTFSVLAGVEGSFYPARRWGIGGRAAGGVMFSPLLMDRTAYEEIVVGTGGSNPGAWGGPENKPQVHEVPHPVFMVGPTFEYYTKLSHFSIGVDVDFLYSIGLDFGLAFTGYFKYTF